MEVSMVWGRPGVCDYTGVWWETIVSAVRRCRRGRVRKDWRSLRVGELMKVWDPDRCVGTCATEPLFLFPNSPLKLDAGLR